MHDDIDFTEFVTFTVAGQMFGLPISRVQDVFKPSRITRVPLAGAEIAGVLNLRGRIVTAIDMRRRLEANRREDGASVMAIGIEARGESFGLLVDAVGEVLKLPMSSASPIRSISAASSPPCPTAFTGSKASCSWCSMSTAFSTCAASAWRRRRR